VVVEERFLRFRRVAVTRPWSAVFQCTGFDGSGAGDVRPRSQLFGKRPATCWPSWSGDGCSEPEFGWVDAHPLAAVGDEYTRLGSGRAAGPSGAGGSGSQVVDQLDMPRRAGRDRPCGRPPAAHIGTCSHAVNPGARCCAARLSPERSKSRNRLSETLAWPVFLFSPAIGRLGRRRLVLDAHPPPVSAPHMEVID